MWWRAAIRLHGLMSHSGYHIGIFVAGDSVDYVDFLQTMLLGSRGHSQNQSERTSLNTETREQRTGCRILAGVSLCEFWFPTGGKN